MKSFEQMTQGQLDFLFEQLGYKRRIVENGPYVWENREFDAMLLLPAIPADQPARYYHLRTLRLNAIEKGIVEPEQFEALLEKARALNAEPAHSQDAA